jgi:hypothetical protein
MSTNSAQFFTNCSASLLLAIGIVFPVATLYAAPPVQAWVQRYPGADGTRIAVDQDGNVIVAAQISEWSGLVIKYSATGTILWTNRPDGNPQSMAIDCKGNVYVTGDVPQLPLGPKTHYKDYVTIAYSGAGTPLWTNRYDGRTNLNDSATGVAADGNGNVYVTGSSDTGLYSRDYVTLAYSNGGTPLWTNRFGAYWQAYPAAIAVDTLGHVYVTGNSPVGEGWPASTMVAYSNASVPLWYQSEVLPGGGAQAIAVDGDGNVYVAGTYMATAAFSSGGTLLWVKNYYWSTATANALAVGNNGNVYVTGYSAGTGTGYDYTTLAYSSLGTPLWTNRYNGLGNTNDYAQALAVGNDGTVYVGGYSWGADSFYDYLTIAYSSDGVPLWTNRYNGPTNGYDQAFAMAVDGSGNIYVTGYSQGDCTTVKYAPAPSIRFSAIDLVPGPACRLTITAPTNLVFRLEASTNLADWLILTNYSNLPYSSIQYTDPLVPDFPRRYYRTAWAP